MLAVASVAILPEEIRREAEFDSRSGFVRAHVVSVATHFGEQMKRPNKDALTLVMVVVDGGGSRERSI